MFVLIGQKAHQRAPDRKDVARSAPRQVNAQRATIRRSPRLVEVEDTGKQARVVVAKSVPMAAVACARRIQGVMPLERKKADQSYLVDRDPELFERLPQGSLGRRGRIRIQPKRPIAADVAATDTIRPAPDSRGAEVAQAIATTTFRRQRQGDRRRQEIRDYRNAFGSNPCASTRNGPASSQGDRHFAWPSICIMPKRLPSVSCA